MFTKSRSSRAIPRTVILILLVHGYFVRSSSAQTVASNNLAADVSAPAVPSTDLSETVIPITDVKLTPIGVRLGFGTGFCLDPGCRFIGTNYHVAEVAKPHKIKGQKIVHRYLATSPTDDGAILNLIPSYGVLKYTPSRDVAIFELRNPLPHHHGIPFNSEDLGEGQPVDIYAFPKETISPFRKLLRFSGTYKGETTAGILLFDYVFDYELSEGKAIVPGASGGIVVDSKSGLVVGVLCGMDLDGKRVASAVSIKSLATFLSKVRPSLAKQLFPFTKEVAAISEDFYPRLTESHDGQLERRPVEPPEITLLREKAQALADDIRNFIAVENLSWCSGDREPSAQGAVELRVIDGREQYRAFPDGKKELNDIPPPYLNNYVTAANEWSALPKIVARERKLKVEQAPDIVISGRKVKVFRYYSTIEDNLCPMDEGTFFGLFSIKKLIKAACYGEAWTDQETNIIRLSVHLALSGESQIYPIRESFETVVIYDWWKGADRRPHLIPLTIYTQSKYKRDKRIYWCRGDFTDYNVFGVHARLVAP